MVVTTRAMKQGNKKLKQNDRVWLRLIYAGETEYEHRLLLIIIILHLYDRQNPSRVRK